MKEAPVENMPGDVSALFDAAQSQRVLITRGGKPIAVVVGLEFKDAEDAAWESSPEFWQMIEERRQRPTLPLDMVEARLFEKE